MKVSEYSDPEEKKKGKNLFENILPNWLQIKIFCSKGIAYFYYSFFFPHSSTFHDPAAERFMTLHLWLPYHFIEISIFSFILLKGKILKWYPSWFFWFGLLSFQRENKCVSFLCVWPDCYNFHFSSENSSWQFQREILQPKDNCHWVTSANIRRLLPFSLCSYNLFISVSTKIFCIFCIFQK